MKTILTNPKSVAMISLLLALPFMTLLLMVTLGVEPNLGPLEALFVMPEDRPNVFGSIIVLGLLIFLLVALIINLLLIRKGICAGEKITAHSLNLILSVAYFLFIILFVSAIVVDQYPCWIGVPNCD
jgi:hypothetical protein